MTIIDPLKDPIDTIKTKLQMDNPIVTVYHISTSIDNEQFMKKHGLLSLNKLLSIEESPICKFLKQHGISIDVKNKIFNYNNEQSIISLDLKNNYLYNCLYVENGLRAIFVYVNNDIMNVEYSCVNRCPEVLYKIEQYIKDYFKHDIKLAREWQAKSNSNIYKINVPIEYLYDAMPAPISKNTFIDALESHINLGETFCLLLDDNFIINYDDMEKL